MSHYRESFRTNPGASEAGRAMAELFSMRGLNADALQVASRYIGGHQKDPEAYLLTIRVAHALERKKIVANGLKRLRAMPGQAAVAAAEQASLLATSGHSEEAVAAVESAEDIDLEDPANAIALRVLVEQLGVLGRHEKAAARVEEALAAHPEEAVFHELQGDALHAGGQADPARAGYERALELDAESWRALAGLAALAAESGDTTGALDLYDRAIAADPEGPAPALAAVALVRETNPEEAARRLEQLLVRHPREVAAANELAGILADRGELERAATYAARAAWFKLPEAEATLARIKELRAPSPEAAVSDPDPADEPTEPTESTESTDATGSGPAS
jgi:tetratricopeptide (TPR) repeat protein